MPLTCCAEPRGWWAIVRLDRLIPVLSQGNAIEHDASLLVHHRAQLALCKGITKMQDSQTAGSYFDFGARWRVAPLAGCPRSWHKGMGCRSPVLVMIFLNGARLPYSTDPQDIAIEAVRPVKKCRFALQDGASCSAKRHMLPARCGPLALPERNCNKLFSCPWVAGMPRAFSIRWRWHPQTHIFYISIGCCCHGRVALWLCLPGRIHGQGSPPLSAMAGNARQPTGASASAINRSRSHGAAPGRRLSGLSV